MKQKLLTCSFILFNLNENTVSKTTKASKPHMIHKHVRHAENVEHKDRRNTQFSINRFNRYIDSSK